MTQYWSRKVSLIVATNDKALDLSELHIVFSVSQQDIQSPNSAIIRIYNAADATVFSIQEEFTRIVLQAGYEGSMGVIFDGEIKQIKIGRENATDTYLDMFCADGDSAYNFAVVNTSLAAGSRPIDVVKAVCTATNPYGVTEGYVPDLPLNQLPRGKVLFGMARDTMRDLANGTDTSWSIQAGKLTVVPITGYLPGQAIVLTSKSGLIGRPEQTQDGIKAKSLLNSQMAVGGRIQIDNKSINQTSGVNGFFIPYDQYTGFQYLASVADDGFYRIISVEHEGDSRGNSWYTNLLCLAVDDAVPISVAVKGWG